jgi:hypothetical protein
MSLRVQSVSFVALIALLGNAGAVTLNIADSCGTSVSGTPTGGGGSPVTVDGSGNIAAVGFSGGSSYIAGLGQCDPVPADGKPVCTLSASKTRIDKGAQVTLFARCTAETDSFTWLGATQAPSPSPNPSTTRSVSLTFPEAGAYTYAVQGARLGVAGNPSGPITVLVGNVSDMPTCSLSISPNAGPYGRVSTARVVCQPEATSYAWQAAEAGAPGAPTGASGDLAFTNFGTFTYKVAGVNAAGTGPTTSSTVSIRNPIEFRSVATRSGTGVMAFPAGTQPTDFLVLFVVSHNGPLPLPTGWTYRQGAYWAINGRYVQLYTKVAGTDTTVNLTASGTMIYAGAILAAYSGVSNVGLIGPFVQTSAAASGCAVSNRSGFSLGSLVIGLLADLTDTASGSDPVGYRSRAVFNPGTYRLRFSDMDNAAGTTLSAAFTQGTGNPAFCNLVELLP